MPFHHDPSHADDLLDQFMVQAGAAAGPSLAILPGQEGRVFELAGG